jgi:hypothetical protein
LLRSSGRSASQARRRARLLAAVAVQNVVAFAGSAVDDVRRASETPRASRARPRVARSRTCASRCTRRRRTSPTASASRSPRSSRPTPALPRLPTQGTAARALPPRSPRRALAHLDAWLACASRSKLGAVRPAHPAALARRRPRCRDARADRRLICAALRGTGPHRRAGAGPRSA